MTLLALPNNIIRVYELYRPKVSGGILSVAHAGVGFEDQLGNVVVLHRTPGNNTHISRYEEFAAGQKVSIKATFKSNQNTIDRAHQLLINGKSYKALTNNCEHLVDFILGRKITSEQVVNTVTATLTTYGLLHLMKKSTKTKLGLAALFGASAFLITKRKKLS
jgi:hypothetical protein